MSVLTLLARVSDGLALSESSDNNDNNNELRSQAKKIIKTFNNRSEKRMSIDTEDGRFYFACLIDHDVVYLTACERSHPKKVAFKYLEELQKEFDIQFGADVQSTRRPYAFISFDNFIQKTKKLYEDMKSQRNLGKVTEDLNDVNQIMSKNISEILERGEKLTSVSKKSEELFATSGIYEKRAKQLNAPNYLLMYGVPAAIILFLVIYIYFKYF